MPRKGKSLPEKSHERAHMRLDHERSIGIIPRFEDSYLQGERVKAEKAYWKVE